MHSRFLLLFPCVSVLALHVAGAQDTVGRPVPASIAARASSAPASGAKPLSQTLSACLSPEIAAAPTRPNWSNGASTTQCGVLEVDSGWLLQTMGGGVVQRLQVSSLRYGLGSRLDLRWAAPGPIFQSGGGVAFTHGVSDQWFSVRYRFLEQGARRPAMAFSYGVKDPAANPAKGFGTGYVDHQLLLIASRDLGRTHFDFNAAGLLAGAAQGQDGAARFGLALAFTVTKRLAWMLESDGGSQPGVPDRFGEALTGVSWTIHPRLVIDSAYTRAYTAGTPRQQFTVGFTYALPSKMLIPVARQGAAGRLLGR